MSARPPSTFEAVERGDPRVAQRSEHPGLALEARETVGIPRHVVRKDLDGHVPTQPLVARAVDLAHAARPQRSDDLVRTEPRASGQGHESRLNSSDGRPAGKRRNGSRSQPGRPHSPRSGGIASNNAGFLRVVPVRADQLALAPALGRDAESGRVCIRRRGRVAPAERCGWRQRARRSDRAHRRSAEGT